MKDHLKWLWAVLVAGFMVVLAFIYGKKPASVIRAQIRENDAKARKLKTQLKVVESKAKEAEGTAEAKEHIEKANTLTIELEAVRAARQKAINETGDLTDDAIAASANAGHNHG